MDYTWNGVNYLENNASDSEFNCYFKDVLLTFKKLSSLLVFEIMF